MNELERDIHAVHFLSKNIENKSKSKFSSFLEISRITKILQYQISMVPNHFWSSVFENSPEMNELERDLYAVQFLAKNIEKQKS